MAGSIYLYFMRTCADTEGLVKLLDAVCPEVLRDRLHSLENKEQQTERATLYCLLMCVLANHEINLDKCELLFTKEGKPYLNKSDKFISLSRTDGCAVVAIADGDIGVDIELMSAERVERVGEICKKCFPYVYFDPKEISDYTAEDMLDGYTSVKVAEFVLDVRADYFSQEATEVAMYSGYGDDSYMKWTVAEAVLKLDGRGFGAKGELEALMARADTYTGVFSLGGRAYRVSLALKA